MAARVSHAAGPEALPGDGDEPRELVVVRHGQSTWNVTHRFTGQADPPLSPLGHRQADALARRCDGLGLDAVVTSDLVRARDTGARVAAYLGLREPFVVSDLRERWSEAMTGLTRDEIEARHPGQLAAWREARAVADPGRHEDFGSFRERVVRGLVAAADHGSRVLVVAHAGIFVVLGQLDGSGSLTETAHAEGRRVLVADGRVRVGDPVRLEESVPRSGHRAP
jgi:probable phosphoglycerate mutase